MKTIVFIFFIALFLPKAHANAWGYAPDETITASEILLRLEDGEDFSKLIEEAFNETFDDEGAVRGMCNYMVKEVNHKQVVDINRYIVACRFRLEKMLKTEEYIEGWGKPELIIDSISKQLDELKFFEKRTSLKGNIERNN